MRSSKFLTGAVGISAMLLFAACGGGDKTAAEAKPDSAAAVATAAPAAAPATAPAAAPATSNAAGEAAFARCIACHQTTGLGIPNVFPPLAGSEWVNGIVDRPIAILIHGLQGQIKVAGNTYTNAMMPYGTGAPMSDEEIAAVLTYVRSNFGNTASAVTAADVARVRAATASRKTQLTQADLEAMK